MNNLVHVCKRSSTSAYGRLLAIGIRDLAAVLRKRAQANAWPQPLRFALGAMVRPQAPAAGIVISLGLGLTILVAVGLIDPPKRSGWREVGDQRGVRLRPPKAPRDVVAPREKLLETEEWPMALRLTAGSEPGAKLSLADARALIEETVPWELWKDLSNGVEIAITSRDHTVSATRSRPVIMPATAERTSGTRVEPPTSTTP